MKAFDLRNQYRTEARLYMKDTNLAAYLNEVEKNQQWEVLLKKVMEKDKINSIVEAYQYIIETSKSGRDEVDFLFKITK